MFTVLLRLLSPIMPWLHYFSTKKSFLFLIPYVYIIIKLLVVVPLAISLIKMVTFSLHHNHSYGEDVSDAELMEMDEKECAICQDELHDPVKLPCNHVFCDVCISEWLDENKTCPICRVTIPQSGIWPYSNGEIDTSIRLF